MNKRTLLICALATALSAMLARAVPSTLPNITVDSAGALLHGTGVADSTQYGQPNNNPTSNLAFLNQEISLWNGVFDPNLPAANGPVALNNESLTGNSYNAPGGYNYAVFHFGNGQAGGSPGGWWQAFYLGGIGSIFNVPSVGGNPVGGFSSARLYNRVPDGGSTLLLLGTAFGVIAAARRKFGV